MHFAFDDDQQALGMGVAAYLAERAGVDYLRRAWADPADPAVWQCWGDLAGMGVHGLLAPVGVGGMDLDWVTIALVLSEVGRAALPLPLAETAAVGVPLLAASGDPCAVLADVVAGRAVLTAAWGPDGLCPASSRADLFLLDASGAPALYRRDEVAIEPVTSVDRTRDAARVRPTGAGVALEGGPALLDAGALASAAVLVGLARAMVDTAVGYVKERRQFGVPVGSFQAVKHHLVDATLHVEFAAPAVWAAAWHLSRPDPDPSEVAQSVSLAKALASDAAALAARKALQCHGAMGYTDEYHLHMWMKRAWCLGSAFGSPEWHRRRIAATLGLDRKEGQADE